MKRFMRRPFVIIVPPETRASQPLYHLKHFRPLHRGILNEDEHQLEAPFRPE
jgi:hypothetical protein